MWLNFLKMFYNTKTVLVQDIHGTTLKLFSNVGFDAVQKFVQYQNTFLVHS
jgi:hypothetical protein